MENYTQPAEPQKDFIVELRHVTPEQLPQKKEKHETILKWLEHLAKAGWLLLAIVAFFVLLPSIKKMLDNSKKVSAFGIEVELKEKIELYNKKSGKVDSLKIESENKAQIIGRVKLLDPFLSARTYKILWTDDEPANNIYMKQIFEQIGFKVDNAGSNTAALDLVKATITDTSLHRYDVIISDYARDWENDPGGLALADSISRIQPFTPFILLSGTFNSSGMEVPSNVYAAALRADHLINYVLDVVERGSTPLTKKY